MFRKKALYIIKTITTFALLLFVKLETINDLQKNILLNPKRLLLAFFANEAAFEASDKLKYKFDNEAFSFSGLPNENVLLAVEMLSKTIVALPKLPQTSSLLSLAALLGQLKKHLFILSIKSLQSSAGLVPKEVATLDMICKFINITYQNLLALQVINGKRFFDDSTSNEREVVSQGLENIKSGTTAGMKNAVIPIVKNLAQLFVTRLFPKIKLNFTSIPPRQIKDSLSVGVTKFEKTSDQIFASLVTTDSVQIHLVFSNKLWRALSNNSLKPEEQVKLIEQLTVILKELFYKYALLSLVSATELNTFAAALVADNPTEVGSPELGSALQSWQLDLIAQTVSYYEHPFEQVGSSGSELVGYDSVIFAKDTADVISQENSIWRWDLSGGEVIGKFNLQEDLLQLLLGTTFAHKNTKLLISEVNHLYKGGTMDNASVFNILYQQGVNPSLMKSQNKQKLAFADQVKNLLSVFSFKRALFLKPLPYTLDFIHRKEHMLLQTQRLDACLEAANLSLQLVKKMFQNSAKLQFFQVLHDVIMILKITNESQPDSMPFNVLVVCTQLLSSIESYIFPEKASDKSPTWTNLKQQFYELGCAEPNDGSVSDFVAKNFGLQKVRLITAPSSKATKKTTSIQPVTSAAPAALVAPVPVKFKSADQNRSSNRALVGRTGAANRIWR